MIVKGVGYLHAFIIGKQPSKPSLIRWHKSFADSQIRVLLNMAV